MTQMLTILMYHYVRPIEQSSHPRIKGLELRNFGRQLDYLDEQFEFIHAEQLIECAKSNADLPDNACLLTFDDGYKDHYLHVFPELKRRGISGCFFPSAGAIVEGKVLDVNKIHFLLDRQPDPQVLLDSLGELLRAARKIADLGAAELPELSDYWAGFTNASRYDSKEISFIKQMLQYLLPDDVRTYALNSLFSRYVSEGEADFAKTLYMSPGEVTELIEGGMYVGSHGHQHVWLNKQTREQQEKEIDSSLDFLRSVHAPTHDWIMCYPYGGYNQDTLDILRSRDCLIGLTTRVGRAEVSGDGTLELARFDTNDFPS